MAIEDDRIAALARAVVEEAIARGITVALAESCTGGLVAGALTGVPGSSAVLERGFVTYSNASKTELLGVPAETISTFGAVSEETAKAMATGALRASRAALAVSITGIAGPGGGSDGKPVGLVHFACAAAGAIASRRMLFGSQKSRAQIRADAVETALQILLDAASTWEIPTNRS